MPWVDPATRSVNFHDGLAIGPSVRPVARELPGSLGVGIKKHDRLAGNLHLKVFDQLLQYLFPLRNDPLQILLRIRTGEEIEDKRRTLPDLEGGMDATLPLQPLWPRSGRL